jgi:hypothetical protein
VAMLQELYLHQDERICTLETSHSSYMRLTTPSLGLHQNFARRHEIRVNSFRGAFAFSCMSEKHFYAQRVPLLSSEATDSHL